MDSRSIPDLKSSIAECKKLRGRDFDPPELAQSETLLAQLEVGGWECTVCLAGWRRGGMSERRLTWDRRGSIHTGPSETCNPSAHLLLSRASGMAT